MITKIPTIYLIGLNRSGTSAVMNAFSNHPKFEIVKDPGKFDFEYSGRCDFRYFFAEAALPTAEARLIKQSIGQYTIDLCTIPLYPIGEDKVPLIRAMYNVFLIRRPSQVFNSWEKMSRWIRAAEDPITVATWTDLQRLYGIEKGWGRPELFELAYHYLYAAYLHFSRVNPERTIVIRQEDLADGPRTASMLAHLCEWAGLRFDPAMMQWRSSFDARERVVSDGFARYADMESPERRQIHDTVRTATGFLRTDSGLVIDQVLAERLDNGIAGTCFAHMSEAADRFQAGLAAVAV